MKIVWFVFLALVSCKASRINDSGPIDSTSDRTLEISFLNSEASYYAVMDAVSGIGSVFEIRYTVGDLYHPFNIVSLRCYKINEHALINFKNRISSCKGVVSIFDRSVE